MDPSALPARHATHALCFSFAFPYSFVTSTRTQDSFISGSVWCSNASAHHCGPPQAGCHRFGLPACCGHVLVYVCTTPKPPCCLQLDNCVYSLLCALWASTFCPPRRPLQLRCVPSFPPCSAERLCAWRSLLEAQSCSHMGAPLPPLPFCPTQANSSQMPTAAPHDLPIMLLQQLRICCTPGAPGGAFRSSSRFVGRCRRRALPARAERAPLSAALQTLHER